MEIAIIPPLRHLELGTGRMHLCLPDLFVDDRYHEFYKERGNRGEYIIMDNGAFERGSANMDRVMDLAKQVNAQEIVLPDHRFDMWDTLYAIDDFIMTLTDDEIKKYKWMAVPTGKTLLEWFECLHRMVQSVSPTEVAHPPVIGISRIMCKQFIDRLGFIRPALTQYMRAFPFKWEVHWLGLHNAGELLNPACRGVRSCDTSFPFKLAKKRIEMSDDYDYWPRDMYSSYTTMAKMNFNWHFTPTELEIARANIKALRKVANLWQPIE